MRFIQTYLESQDRQAKSNISSDTQHFWRAQTHIVYQTIDKSANEIAQKEFCCYEENSSGKLGRALPILSSKYLCDRPIHHPHRSNSHSHFVNSPACSRPTPPSRSISPFLRNRCTSIMFSQRWGGCKKYDMNELLVRAPFGNFISPLFPTIFLCHFLSLSSARRPAAFAFNRRV